MMLVPSLVSKFQIRIINVQVYKYPSYKSLQIIAFFNFNIAL